MKPLISQNVVAASEYLTDSHQANFFEKDTLVFKKSAIDGFYPHTRRILKLKYQLRRSIC